MSGLAHRKQVNEGQYEGETLSSRLRSLAAGAITITLVGAFTGVSAGPASAGGCGYSGASATVTTISVAKSKIAFGARDKVTATVYSGAGAPSGNVVFKVNGLKLATKAVTAQDANDSTATWMLPRHLKAGKTYTVAAIHRANCDFERSVDRTGVRVVRATTATALSMTNTPLSSGMHPKATLTVTSATGKTVKGFVTIVLKRGSQVLQRKHYTLVGGSTDVRVKRVHRVGTYRLVVRYHHRRNFAASRASVSFSVS